MLGERQDPARFEFSLAEGAIPAYRLKTNAVAGRETVASRPTMSRLSGGPPPAERRIGRPDGTRVLQVASIGGGNACGDIAHAVHPHCIGRARDAWRAARHDDDSV